MNNIKPLVYSDYYYYFNKDYKVSKFIADSLKRPILGGMFSKVSGNTSEDDKVYAYLLFAHQAFEKGLKYLVQNKYDHEVYLVDKERACKVKQDVPSFIRRLINSHKLKDMCDKMLENGVISEDVYNKISLNSSLALMFNNYYLTNRYPYGKDIILQRMDLESIYWALESLHNICSDLSEHPRIMKSSSF